MSNITPYAFFNTSWVWRSTPESIGKRQGSVLALAEILVSMLVFLWVAKSTPWPWMTLVGFLAVPFLLLRSRQSVDHALCAYKHYIKDNSLVAFPLRLNHTRSEYLVIAGSFLMTVLLIYMLAMHWLPAIGYRPFDRESPWQSSFVSALGGTLVVSFTVAIWNVKYLTLLIAGAGCAVILGYSVLALTGIFAFKLVPPLSAMFLWFMFVIILFMPSFFLGMFFRFTWIRFLSTLRFLGPGLDSFTRNIQVSLIVADSFQPPELLPELTTIENRFSVSSILTNAFGGDKHTYLLDIFVRLAIVIVVILPATLYRMNIKATAWLWGTIAFFLRPRVWGNDDEERSRLANLGTDTAKATLVFVILMGWFVLLKELLPLGAPETLKYMFPEEWQKFLPLVPSGPPLLSARFLACFIVLATLTWFRFTNSYFQNANHGVITNPHDWNELSKTDAIEPVRQKALKVLQVLRWVIVSLIFAVQVFTFWALAYTSFGQARFPNAVWLWIRPYL